MSVCELPACNAWNEGGKGCHKVRCGVQWVLRSHTEGKKGETQVTDQCTARRKGRKKIIWGESKKSKGEKKQWGWGNHSCLDIACGGASGMNSFAPLDKASPLFLLSWLSSAKFVAFLQSFVLSANTNPWQKLTTQSNSLQNPQIPLWMCATVLRWQFVI